MIKLPPGIGRTAGVAGVGRSGAAAARLLAARGYSVIGFDSSENAVQPEHVNRLIKGEPVPSDLADLSLLVMSPGVPPNSSVQRMAESLGVPVTAEVELGWACTEADVIAVTGSNGKTTTVEWVGHVLRNTPGYSNSVVAGNMGYAMSDAVLDNPDCGVFTLELSSYQLEAIEDLRGVCAAVLNLTPDHLARHGSMENYGAAKARIFMNQNQDDTAVLNMDDPLLTPMRDMVKGRLLLFSLEQEVSAGAWMDREGMLHYRDRNIDTPIVSCTELSIPGRHNIANALAVICLAASYGVPPDSLAISLRSFKGVPHRIEMIGLHKGIYWVNDSKSTNVDSLKVALESFSNRVILLAGGLKKDSDYSVLRNLISSRVKAAVLFGSAAESLAGQWNGATEIHLADDLHGAVAEALDTASPGDTVLLSPGCASFDQYRDFEARGEHFRKIVKGLR